MELDIPVHYIPLTVRRKLSEFLEVQGFELCGWKSLMEKLSYRPTCIEFTSNAPRSAGETNTEMVLKSFASKGGTVGQLMKALEEIEYLDARLLLQNSFPAIRNCYETHSTENGMGYSGGHFLQHPPGCSCHQFLEPMDYQESYDLKRHHAVQTQHPGTHNSFTYNWCDLSMAAEASPINSMNTEATLMPTGYFEFPVAAADVQLRDCNRIDRMIARPLEPHSPPLSATSPCDRNNNSSELVALLNSPSRDIKPTTNELLVTRTEQQNRPSTQSSPYSTAAETKENDPAEAVVKKEEEKLTSCCKGSYPDHGLGVDVRPRTSSSSPWRPDDRQAVVDSGVDMESKPRVLHEAPLQTLSNGPRTLGSNRRRIFVTYVHDDNRHMKRITSLMQFLISNGFSACVDSCESRAGDRSGEVLKHSFNRFKQFGFVLFCISPEYKKVVAGHRNEHNNTKHLNAKAIHQIMEEEYHNINKDTPPLPKRRYRSIPVLFTESKATQRDVPGWLKNCGPVYEWPAQYRHLAFYLSRPESCFDDLVDTKSCITQSVTPC